MSDTEERDGLPRWVYLTVIAVLVVAVLVVLMLTMGDGHQPRPH